MVYETHPFVPGFDYGIGFWNKENALGRQRNRMELSIKGLNI